MKALDALNPATRVARFEKDINETVTHSDNVYDAIIIGGGHNGLVAASYLAKAGKAVLLLEAQDELGGATTSVTYLMSLPRNDHNLSAKARAFTE